MSIIEEWKPVVGYEGWYEVSDQGRVRSVERVVPNGKGGTKRMKAKMMTCTGRASQRYLFVSLCKNNKPQRLLVHRLVLEAFIGPCPEGMETLHGEGGSYDNRLANLCWGTKEENCRDKWLQGSMPHGESHSRSKLTEEQVRSIKTDTRSYGALQQHYKVSKSCIASIKTNRNWAWLS
jgi:hypothetical protein